MKHISFNNGCEVRIYKVVKHQKILIVIISLDEYDILVIAQIQGKDIIRIYLGYNWLITQKTLPFYKQATTASSYVHLSQSSFVIYNLFL